MTITEELTAFLKQERNGLKLGGALVAVLVRHYVDVCNVEEMHEIELKTLKQTAVEAWKHAKEGSELPYTHSDRLTKWVAPSPSALHEVQGVQNAVTSMSGGEGIMMTEDEEATLFGEVGPTDRDRMQLARDKQAQNLSGLRIATLSCALELGRVPMAGAMTGVIYGTDPRTLDMAKVARKAGMVLLTKVLESKDSTKICSFLNNLVRDY